MGKIVWLASYPKSGNTWTRVFLMNLYHDAKAPLAANEIARMLPSDVRIDWYRRVDPGRSDDWSLEEIARLRPRVQKEICDLAPDSPFVKTHAPRGLWKGAPIFNMAVTAGAVYVVRNPLDIVASYAQHSGLTVDQIIEIMARPGYLAPGSELRVAHPIGSWSENVGTWTGRPHPAIHVMRYEDMVADPMAAFGGLVRFLQLPADEERVGRAVRFSSFEELRRQEDATGFVETSENASCFFRSGRVGGWREELVPAQAAAVVAAHRAQMMRFGYVPEGM